MPQVKNCPLSEILPNLDTMTTMNLGIIWVVVVVLVYLAYVNNFLFLLHELFQIHQTVAKNFLSKMNCRKKL
jgi:hypothetical protein